MRRRSLILVVAAAVAFVAVPGVVAWRDTSARVGSASTSTTTARFATQTAAAGPVSIKIQPRRIDSTGAEFTVSLDTHSAELDLDVAANAHLSVGVTDRVAPVGRATSPEAITARGPSAS